ncbi:hypothetical protein PMAC_001146 [Pneumocystis sp. 'macacae']|nr:hypothetical protein PMAC_001146 [Pneumocystis sp. 'macacae']
MKKSPSQVNLEGYHLNSDCISITDQNFKEVEKKSVSNGFLNFTVIEICFICVESFTEPSIPSCNHSICQKCSLRLRALYNDMNCAYCKTFQPNVIFSKELKNYNDFELEKLLYKNEKFGIFFETQQLMENILSVLNFNCPKYACNVICNDWQDLKDHAKNSHGKYLCDLCIDNKKVFTYEHVLFSENDLLVHIKKGDFGNKKNKTGFRGHPGCGFCKRSFYDDDDLYKHCREFHERCHVCDQMAGQLKHQYYLDYDSLEKHFQNDHYMCSEIECLEKRFVVFGTEFDLRAHQLEVHKNNLSSKALKEAKRIPVSCVFDCPVAYRYSKGKNIVGTSNRLQSYDEYMTRSEKALKRQEENMLRQSRNFGVFSGDTILKGSRIQSLAVGPSNSRSGHSYATFNSFKDEEFPGLGEETSIKSKELSKSNGNGFNNSLSCSSFSCDSKIIGDNEKIRQFLSSISAFSTSVMSAVEFIEFLLVLFNYRLEEINKVLSRIVDLIHSDNKKSEFLVAWNDWKVNNQTKKTFVKIINCSRVNPLPSFDFVVNSSVASDRNNFQSFLGSSYTTNFPSLCSMEKKTSSQYFHSEKKIDSQNVWNHVDKKNIVAEENIELKIKNKKKNKNKKGTIIFRMG